VVQQSDNGKRQRNLGTYCSEVLLLLASSFVLSLAFPGFLSKSGFGFLAFVALIPVFVVIHRTRPAATPFYGFFYGFMFYLFFNYWLRNFHPLAIFIVTIIKGGEMALLFPCLKMADSWCKKWSWLVQAFIWTAYTYLCQSWFAGYPYGTIAYALWNYLPLVQIASVTGIWGVNLLLVMPQSFIAMPVARRERVRGWLRDRRVWAVAYVVGFVLWLVLGTASWQRWKRMTPDRSWKVAVVQHNANSWKGGYTTYKRNFNNLRKLSLEAMAKHPDILVWSETAFVPSVAWHENYPTDPDTSALVEEFVNFGKELSVPLITGNPEGVLSDPSLPPELEDGTWNREDYNTVIMFDDGQIKQTYRKQHLVPFTEHFPYEKTMPHLYNLLKANDYHWWLTGTESVVFESDGIKFSTPICFEDVYGDLNAEFVRGGADVLMNMTNDNWSQSEASEIQHGVMAVYRSVENRRTMIRSTNSGLSCYITPDGQVHDELPLFKAMWHIFDVPVYLSSTHAETVYTRYGDWLAYLSIWVSILSLSVGLAVTIVTRRKRH